SRQTARTTAQSPQGPITRARSKELKSRTGVENATAHSNATAESHNIPIKNIEHGLRQLRLDTEPERVSRNRAPRTTTSSRSSGLGRIYPVRIGHERPQNSDSGSFLKNKAVPSAREFHQELLRRNSSLGSCERAASTPKDVHKQSTTDGLHAKAGPPSKRSDVVPMTCASNVTRPQRGASVRPTPRASSVTRPPPAPLVRPAPRASSVTRAPIAPHPSNIRSTARSSSVTRPAVRPPSVTRPHVRAPSVTRPQIPHSDANVRDVTRHGTLPRSSRAQVGRGSDTTSASNRTTRVSNFSVV
ncbi:unnamed protein product, partial [Strongylus vulgaris]